MTNEKVRRLHGERGASLILAIAFMVVIGGISSAVLATTTSGLQERVTLDQARNREYAADGAIESTVVAARNLSNPACPSQPSTPFNLDGFNIHIDCSSVATSIVVVNPTTGGLELVTQNDLLFVACLAMGPGAGTACTLSTGTDPPIINAQVNFQGTAPVTTWVQAWSVNR